MKAKPVLGRVILGPYSLEERVIAAKSAGVLIGLRRALRIARHLLDSTAVSEAITAAIAREKKARKRGR